MHELGLQDRMITAPNAANRTCVLDRGVPKRVPLDPITFLTTSLLSPGGKARLFAEPFIPARRDGADEFWRLSSTAVSGVRRAVDLSGPSSAGSTTLIPEHKARRPPRPSCVSLKGTAV